MIRFHRRRSDLRTGRRLRSTGDLVVQDCARGNAVVDLHLIGENDGLTGFEKTSPRKGGARQSRISGRSTVDGRLQRTGNDSGVIENRTQIIVDLYRIELRLTGVGSGDGVLDRLAGLNRRTGNRISSLLQFEAGNRVIRLHRRRSDVRTGGWLRSTGDLVVQNRARGNAGIDLHLVGQNNRLTSLEIGGPRQNAARQGRSSDSSTVDGRLQRARNDGGIVENRTQIVFDRRGSQGRLAGVSTGDRVRNGIAGLNRRTCRGHSGLRDCEPGHGMRRAEIGCRIACCGRSCCPRNEVVVQDFVTTVFDRDGVGDCPFAAGWQCAADFDFVGAIQCSGESAGSSTDRNRSVINDVGEEVRVVDRCRRSAGILEIQSVGDCLADIDRLTGRW